MPVYPKQPFSFNGGLYFVLHVQVALAEVDFPAELGSQPQQGGRFGQIAATNQDVRELLSQIFHDLVQIVDPVMDVGDAGDQHSFSIEEALIFPDRRWRRWRDQSVQS